MLFTFFIIEGLKKIYLAFISMYKFQASMTNVSISIHQRQFHWILGMLTYP
jgi:nuclear transport factor 2 (NTF2) superfamily protein